MSLDKLKIRLADIANINHAASVLGWDQRTYMPPAGAGARASQLGTLAKIGHDLFVSAETQDLLAAAEAGAKGLAKDADDARLLVNARRQMTKQTKVPTALIVAITETTTLTEEKWVVTRKENDFAGLAPWLGKVFDLKREYAQAIGYKARIYDALLDDFELGMTADVLDPLFEQLKAATVPLVAEIAANQNKVSDDILKRPVSEAQQEAFGVAVLKDCGYDFNRGRLDRSTHPFCTNFSCNDVRITTRYDLEWMPGSLFGCLHEMGHALYEMGISEAYEGTPLAGGVSLGVHESQSRLWENLVGRSKGFWRHYFPKLQKAFAPTFNDVTLEGFYKAINAAAPSLIRVEADEVTYNLHIILRYEMEQEILERKLSIADAPGRWNEKMQKYLGLTPPTDREGILQDIHWPGGGIGYFPTYTLGNILATQLFEAAGRAMPGLEGDIAGANFAGLRKWLEENVHVHGSKYPPGELIQRATGSPLRVEPYLAYLKGKYGEIYEL